MAKRTRKRVRALERLHQDSNHPTGAHAAAAGYTDAMNVAKPDECKSGGAESNAVPTGNPVTNPFQVNRAKDNPGVAVGHSDLMQQPPMSAFQQAIRHLRTQRGNVMDLGFSPDSPSTVQGGYSRPGTADMAVYPADEHAGRFSGMQGFNDDPHRPDYHMARTSGTRDNGYYPSCYQDGGYHANGDAQSHVVNIKSRSKLDVMKEHLRAQGMFGDR